MLQFCFVRIHGSRNSYLHESISNVTACLLPGFFTDPDDQINERGQADEDADGDVDAVEDGGGGGASGADEGGFEIDEGFVESFHD